VSPVLVGITHLRGCHAGKVEIEVVALTDHDVAAETCVVESASILGGCTMSGDSRFVQNVLNVLGERLVDSIRSPIFLSAAAGVCASIAT
jgi:hypothetical protein